MEGCCALDTYWPPLGTAALCERGCCICRVGLDMRTDGCNMEGGRIAWAEGVLLTVG